MCEMWWERWILLCDGLKTGQNKYCACWMRCNLVPRTFHLPTPQGARKERPWFRLVTNFMILMGGVPIYKTIVTTSVIVTFKTDSLGNLMESSVSIFWEQGLDAMTFQDGTDLEPTKWQPLLISRFMSHQTGHRQPNNPIKKCLLCLHNTKIPAAEKWLAWLRIPNFDLSSCEISLLDINKTQNCFMLSKWCTM